MAGEGMGGGGLSETCVLSCLALSTHFTSFHFPQAATAPTTSPAAFPLTPALAAARLPPDVLAPLPLASLDDGAVVAAAEWDRVLREAAPRSLPRAVLPPPARPCGPPDAATAAATSIQLAWRRHAARAIVTRLRAAPADGRSVAAAARAAARAAAAAALPSITADVAATDGAAAREAARAAALAWADANRDDAGALPASLPVEEEARPPPPPPPPPLHTLRAPPAAHSAAAHDVVRAWTGAWAGGAPTAAEDAAAARGEAAAAAVAAATAAGRADAAAQLRDARAAEAKAGQTVAKAPAAAKKQASPPPKKQAGVPPPAAPPAARPLPPLDRPLLTTLADLAARGIAGPPPKRVLWHASPAGLAVEAPRWPSRAAAAAAVAATVCARLGVAAARSSPTPFPGPPAILLHGPHGGGKTALVRWAAAACRARVFCVSPAALAPAPSDAAATALVRAVLTAAAACGPAIVHVPCVDVTFVRDAGRAAAALAARGEDVSLPPTRLRAALLSPLAEAAATTAAGAPFIVTCECGAPPAATAHDGEALAAAFAGGLVGVGPLSRADAAAVVVGACAARCIRPPSHSHLSALASSAVGWTAGAVVAAVVAAARAAPDATTPLDGSAVAAALATGRLPPAAGDLEAGLAWAAAGGGAEEKTK